MRIVSLLPSATEILCGLGLRDSLVGVTHECDFPISVSTLPKVTRTRIPHEAASGEIDKLVREQLESENALYSLDVDRLESLQPDVIVTQSVCDVCAVAESEVHAAASSLASHPKVINLEPSSLTDVFQCIAHVGRATQRTANAENFVAELQGRVDTVAARTRTIQRRPKTVMLEWIDPPFSAGHWSPELVSLAGGREVIGEAGRRSVTTPWQKIVDADPEVMVIACCGFDVPRTLQDLPLLQSYEGWETLRCVQSKRLYVVNGSSYFSRPGPRLVDSLEILAHTLHPEIHPLPEHLPAATTVLNLPPEIP